MNHPFPPSAPLVSSSLVASLSLSLFLCRSLFLLRETPPWTNYTYRQSSLVPRGRFILSLSLCRLSIFLRLWLTPSRSRPSNACSLSPSLLPIFSLCPRHPCSPITTIRNDHVIIATPVEHVPVRISPGRRGNSSFPRTASLWMATDNP